MSENDVAPVIPICKKLLDKHANSYEAAVERQRAEREKVSPIREPSTMPAVFLSIDGCSDMGRVPVPAPPKVKKPIVHTAYPESSYRYYVLKNTILGPRGGHIALYEEEVR